MSSLKVMLVVCVSSYRTHTHTHHPSFWLATIIRPRVYCKGEAENNRAVTVWFCRTSMWGWYIHLWTDNQYMYIHYLQYNVHVLIGYVAISHLTVHPVSSWQRPSGWTFCSWVSLTVVKLWYQWFINIAMSLCAALHPSFVNLTWGNFVLLV